MAKQDRVERLRLERRSEVISVLRSLALNAHELERQVTMEDRDALGAAYPAWGQDLSEAMVIVPEDVGAAADALDVAVGEVADVLLAVDRVNNRYDLQATSEVESERLRRLDEMSSRRDRDVKAFTDALDNLRVVIRSTIADFSRTEAI